MNIKKRAFTNTALALKEFDKVQPERDKTWLEVKSDSGVTRCMLADLVALEKVQAAFHLDTMDINCKDSCKLISIDFMRSMAVGT